MKHIKKIVLFLTTIIMTISFVGCQGNVEKTNNKNSGEVKSEDNLKSQIQYADNSYIVSADWVATNLDKKEDVLVLDARGDEAYSKGHIPGAISVTWQQFSNMNGAPGDKGWGTILPAEELSKKLAEIGITKDKTIVVYSDTKNGWGEDGRIVWMLRMAGVSNSKFLDGGFNFWESKEYEVSNETVTAEASDIKIEKLDENLTIDTETLKSELENVKILDSRDEDEYEGATKYGEVRGGHIPNAIHFSFKSLLNEDGTLKGAEEIEGILTEVGLNKEDKIVTYCTAGIRSAHLAVVLNMMGYNNVENYDESFYTWAKDESLEVVK